ncbi:hypothetical protein B2M26_08620 [Ferroacidibacillus organovorans]|uniref:Uncharacterized protein n=1 Tax=Ferroacidibacillus organovorans TaxID=1765683 RepID=A0A1V4ET29_9BACL|nr:hypothetical protein B2M26_08620 [Ferroacidibacillus organovorans]
MWLSFEMSTAGKSTVSKLWKTTFCWAIRRAQRNFPGVGEPGMLHNDYTGTRETMYALPSGSMANNRITGECQMANRESDNCVVMQMLQPSNRTRAKQFQLKGRCDYASAVQWIPNFSLHK